DNLFWLGRYAERAEQAIRIVRTALRAYRGAIELDRPDLRSIDDLFVAVTQMTGTHPGFADVDLRAAPMPELVSVVLDGARVGSIAFDLQAMLTAAYAVRDQISADTWRVLTDVNVRLAQLQARPRDTIVHDLHDELDDLVTSLVAVFALARESM